MKRLLVYLLFMFCIISGTLICRALTNKNALMPEEDKTAIKNALNEEIGDDLLSVKFFRKNPQCKVLGKKLLKQAIEDPYFFYIVDKEHLLSADYMPQDLIGEGKKVRNETYEAFTQMANAAKKENINLFILSGFRTYKYQESLFMRSVANNGIEHANKYVAKPGASQHQLGTAVDINSVEDSFVNTKEYAWLKENAAKFGFIFLPFRKG